MFYCPYYSPILGMVTLSCFGLGMTASDRFMEFLSHDIPDTIGGAASARVFFEVLQVVAVIERQLLAGRNRPHTHDPDPVFFFQTGFAIGFTTVIKPTCRIPGNVPIQIPLLVK